MNNYKINLVSVDMSIPFSNYEKYLILISKERCEKIARLKFEKDKILSFFAEIEMRTEISNYTGLNFSDIEFNYNKYGKPYIKNLFNKECHFSLSHSGNLIGFAVADKPIGIDVENIGEARLKIAKRFFTENEYNFIISAENPTLEFFKIWTKKEAYLKMIGTGLSKSLSSFDVLSVELQSYFATTVLNQNALTICYENANLIKSEINFINAENLIKDKKSF